ncbi:hypothetical protein pmac_cds_350 [Pandoravirus macleodensis]|uniref:Uncharacterized protein n=1 Tax=Pandoravirus macleodensis TaxID=2107707 RepID=A0A2U7UEZ4_9VIRU|nr:hypothetical protein pmac_cds_350 [Pandoravirus macleodensis]AVK77038.1 hypothetical protein pmac_cds_350 [Pandoravirus macleodensis]
MELEGTKKRRGCHQRRPCAEWRSPTAAAATEPRGPLASLGSSSIDGSDTNASPTSVRHPSAARSSSLVIRSPRSVWRNLAAWARSHRTDRRDSDGSTAHCASPLTSARSVRTASPRQTLSSLSLSSSLSCSSISLSSSRSTSSASPTSSPPMSPSTISRPSPPLSPSTLRTLGATWSHAYVSSSALPFAHPRHTKADSFSSSPSLSSSSSSSSISLISSSQSLLSPLSTPTTSPSTSGIYVTPTRLIDAAALPLRCSRRLLWAHCIKFVIKDANNVLDVTLVAVPPLDIDLVWLYKVARILYGAVNVRRGDPDRDACVYHDCATGGLFPIDTVDALDAARRRWATHVLDLPAVQRRCMRYRIVATDRP